MKYKNVTCLSLLLFVFSMANMQIVVILILFIVECVNIGFVTFVETTMTEE